MTQMCADDRSVKESRVWGKKMERAMGIEPTCEAWKASVLPLNYTRNRAEAYQPGLRCQSVFPSLCACE